MAKWPTGALVPSRELILLNEWARKVDEWVREADAYLATAAGALNRDEEQLARLIAAGLMCDVTSTQLDRLLALERAAMTADDRERMVGK